MPQIEIPNGVYPGRTVSIKGHLSCDSGDFQINFLRGPEGTPTGTVGFHMNFRMHEGRVATNSFRNGHWEHEISHPCMPVKRCGRFRIDVKCEPDGYVVFVDGEEFCAFPLRMPFEEITHLCVSGDVGLDGLSWY